MSQAGIINSNSSSPTVPTLFVENVGSAVPALNTLNVIGGTGISTSGAGNTIIINSTSSGFAWNVVTTPNILVSQNGYIAKGGAPVAFTLPAAAAIGDTYIILGYSNLWTLAQNAGQSIFLGSATTTVGVGGSISATQVKDTITLVCVTPNTEFHVLECMGNPLLV